MKMTVLVVVVPMMMLVVHVHAFAISIAPLPAVVVVVRNRQHHNRRRMMMTSMQYSSSPTPPPRRRPYYYYRLLNSRRDDRVDDYEDDYEDDDTSARSVSVIRKQQQQQQQQQQQRPEKRQQQRKNGVAVADKSSSYKENTRNNNDNDKDDYYDYYDDDYDDYDDEDEDDFVVEDTTINSSATTTNQLLVWERCETVNAGMAHVLLPPIDVRVPSCILHFIGGTFFGSAPNIWYKVLLEELVQQTNAIVIATSIPVTVFTSPLEHVDLARQCQKQFETAYRDIVLDEYGNIDNIQNVPICGIGHSLGARLHTVLATLPPKSRMKGNKPWLPKKHHPYYTSMILISFTNYGAAAGIPGLYELTKSSQRVRQEQIINQAAGGGRTNKNNNNSQQQQQKKRTKQQRRNNGRRRRNKDGDYYGNDDDYNYDDEDDDDILIEDDIDSLWIELQDIVRQSTLNVKSALTPSSEALEFHPTPTQLWKAIANQRRYTIPKTLVVQFDNDRVDQSSQLATHILQGFSNNNNNNNNSNNNTNSTVIEDIINNNNNKDMIKFARLRGTHLTPVSIDDKRRGRRLSNNSMDNSSNNLGWFQRINQQAGKILVQVLATTTTSTSTKKKRLEQEQSFIELRQSIARYITDVVTKE